MQAEIRKNFASDNNAGVHPEIMKAIESANRGHVVGYGDDPFTASAIQRFKEVLGNDIDVYFVYGGTGANVLALQAMLRSHEAVICANTSHINVDECGAPENFTGSKLIPLPSQKGKIEIEQIEPLLESRGFPHHVQPGVISVSQPTELGTVYTIEELQTLSYFAHQNNMRLHVDGARLSNAAAALNCPLHAITADVDVDVLSFGGTKNGLMFGEAVVFFNTDLSHSFKYIRKQGMQLHSKMRYIAAQFNRFLTDDLWLHNALHANEMARYLFKRVSELEGIEVTQAVETNGVFVKLPAGIIEPLQEEYFFYIWNAAMNEVRWMTAWDTTEEDIERFVSALQALLTQ